MHPFFAPLNEWELALLLTTLTVGGSDQGSIFAALPQATALRLQDKAQALLQIAPDKRVQLMVRELKSALDFNGLRGIERVDPSWVVNHLKGESARVVASILVNLPAAMVRSVLRRLPPTLRQELPPKSELRGIPSDLLRGIRQLFEARFVPMPPPSQGPFGFRDIIHLERSELHRLVRDLGLTELGQAFVTVGKMALLELCRRLPKKHAQELIHAVKVASRMDLPDAKTAQRFLSRVVVNFENTEEFLQKSGLWRLGKACQLEGPVYRGALSQRLPVRAAHYLNTYIEKAGEMEDLTPDVLQRLQDSILVRTVLLARQTVISGAWADHAMQYHDPGAAQQAMDDAEMLAEPTLAENSENDIELEDVPEVSLELPKRHEDGETH